MAKLQIKNENLAPFGGFFRVIGIFSAKPAPATVSYLKVTAFENTSPLSHPLTLPSPLSPLTLPSLKLLGIICDNLKSFFYLCIVMIFIEMTDI